jgi:hypothetical protein
MKALEKPVAPDSLPSDSAEGAVMTALDLGSHTFRSARLLGGSLRARRVRAEYCPVPDNRIHREFLATHDISFLECEAGLVVPGDDANKVARFLQVPTHAVLPGGRLAPGDRLGRQVINVLLESVLPPGTPAGCECAVTFPAGTEQDGSETVEFLSRLIKLRGYTPRPLAQGLALGLAELGGEQFTGLCLQVGHSATQLVVLRLGRMVASDSLGKAGEWLEEHLRRDRTAATREEQAHSNACRELAWEIARESVRLLNAGACRLLPRPLTLLCGGGCSQMPGFPDLIAEAIGHRDPTCGIHSIRTASASPYTICRGALIHAELDSPLRRAS